MKTHLISRQIPGEQKQQVSTFVSDGWLREPDNAMELQ